MEKKENASLILSLTQTNRDLRSEIKRLKVASSTETVITRLKRNWSRWLFFEDVHDMAVRKTNESIGKSLLREMNSGAPMPAVNKPKNVLQAYNEAKDDLFAHFEFKKYWLDYYGKENYHIIDRCDMHFRFFKKRHKSETLVTFAKLIAQLGIGGRDLFGLKVMIIDNERAIYKKDDMTMVILCDGKGGRYLSTLIFSNKLQVNGNIKHLNKNLN